VAGRRWPSPTSTPASSRAPAHQGRAERLHPGPGRGRGGDAGADRQGHRRRQGRAEHGRPRPGQGGVGHRRPTSGPDRVEARRGLRRADHAEVPRRRLRLRRQEEHPAHDRRARLRASPWCRRKRPRPTCSSSSPTASSWPTAPATRSLATTPSAHVGTDRDRHPTFGICLGHQIMALASGAKTFKMKFGHHGANHPVKDLDNGRVSITSQNHGFAVDEKSLPANLRPRTSACSTARCRAWRAPTSPRSASRATRKPRRARTTSATCSTASRH
jgi:hypothetical protein